MEHLQKSCKFIQHLPFLICCCAITPLLVKACGGWGICDPDRPKLGGLGGRAGGWQPSPVPPCSSFPNWELHSSTGVLLPLLLLLLLLLLPLLSSSLLLLLLSNFELDVVAGESLSLLLLLLLLDVWVISTTIQNLSCKFEKKIVVLWHHKLTFQTSPEFFNRCNCQAKLRQL